MPSSTMEKVTIAEPDLADPKGPILDNDFKSESPKRLQIDLTPDAWDLLSQIREKMDVKSNADLVRKALAVYGWLVNEFKPEDTLSIQNEKKETISMLSIKAIKTFSL